MWVMTKTMREATMGDRINVGAGNKGKARVRVRKGPVHLPISKIKRLMADWKWTSEMWRTTRKSYPQHKLYNILIRSPDLETLLIITGLTDDLHTLITTNLKPPIGDEEGNEERLRFYAILEERLYPADTGRRPLNIVKLRYLSPGEPAMEPPNASEEDLQDAIEALIAKARLKGLTGLP